MPLSNSEPKQFGVKQFSEICDRCAKACQPKALPFSPPSTEVYNKSNIIGISKWSTDAEKCFKFWANQNSDCSICIRVCPYNRDFSYWPNRI
ncbi:MAG: 4Fe-4S double cluster binding domain-containing protein [Pseudomonadales bacterium]